MRSRRARRLALWAGALALAVWLSLAPRDPALFPEAGGTRVLHVVDHGWHSGVVIAAADLRAAALLIGRERPDLAHRLRRIAAEWPRAQAFEFGWGDAEFYRATPGLGDIRADLALAAVLWPTPSTLQVVPLWGAPEAAFPGSGRLALAVSDAGLAALARRLAETAAPLPETGLAPLGPSLYGAGLFLPARPSYHGLRTCNHWVSALLRAAGVPSSWIASFTSAGLLAELRLRLG